MISHCIGCHRDSLETLLITPKLPVANDYHSIDQNAHTYFKLELCICKMCSLVQLKNPPSPDIVRPKTKSIIYNEPESHLDDVVKVIQKLPGVVESSNFLGITYKEDTTFERLSNLSYTNIQRLDMELDLRITEPHSGLETVQKEIASCKLGEKIGKVKQFDVVVARHILEHAHRPRDFLNSIMNTVKEDGYLVLEVPDCSRAFIKFDYTTLWEEHISYFTEFSLKRILNEAGFKIVYLGIYPQPYEDSIVVVIKRGKEIFHSKGLELELENARRFGGEFLKKTDQIKAYLEHIMSAPSLLFGAGHLATSFVHLTDTASLFYGVLDDDFSKLGLALPGTSIPILPSTYLNETEVKLCLLTMNPLSEERIISKFSRFLDKGGTYLSIFPSSSRAVYSNIKDAQE